MISVPSALDLLNRCGIQTYKGNILGYGSKKWQNIQRFRMNPVETEFLWQLRNHPGFRAAIEETAHRIFGDGFEIELFFGDDFQSKSREKEFMFEEYEKLRELFGKKKGFAKYKRESDNEKKNQESKEDVVLNDQEIENALNVLEKHIKKNDNNKAENSKKRKRTSSSSSSSTGLSAGKLNGLFNKSIIQKYWVPWLIETFIVIKMWGFCPYVLKSIEYGGNTHYYPHVPELDGGFVEVYTLNHEKHLVWTWLSSLEPLHTQYKNRDDCIDESVRFIVKDNPGSFGSYNSDLKSLLKDYLHVDITEDLKTQAYLKNVNPTHIIEYEEKGKSTNTGDAESQWYQTFSRNNVNLQFEKFKMDQFYEDRGFQAHQFFFAHDRKNLKNSSQLTGFENNGVEGWVPDNRLSTLMRISRNVKRRMDISSMNDAPGLEGNPVTSRAFIEKRLEENEKFVQLNPIRIDNPDFQFTKNRFDRLVAIIADNSLFMSLLTSYPSSSSTKKSPGSGSLSSVAGLEETKIHFSSRYKSITQFYSQKISFVWADAYTNMFTEEIKHGRDLMVQKFQKNYGRSPKYEEIDVFQSLLHINVTFPKTAYMSIQEMKETYMLGLISEKNFYKQALSVTGMEDEGEEGIQRATKRLKELAKLELEATKPKENTPQSSSTNTKESTSRTQNTNNNHNKKTPANTTSASKK